MSWLKTPRRLCDMGDGIRPTPSCLKDENHQEAHDIVLPYLGLDAWESRYHFWVSIARLPHVPKRDIIDWFQAMRAEREESAKVWCPPCQQYGCVGVTASTDVSIALRRQGHNIRPLRKVPTSEEIQENAKRNGELQALDSEVRRLQAKHNTARPAEKSRLIAAIRTLERRIDQLRKEELLRVRDDYLDTPDARQVVYEPVTARYISSDDPMSVYVSTLEPNGFIYCQCPACTPGRLRGGG